MVKMSRLKKFLSVNLTAFYFLCLTHHILVALTSYWCLINADPKPHLEKVTRISYRFYTVWNFVS